VTARFYPALLTCKGPLRWEARVLDFAIWGQGDTMQNAKNDAKERLQAHVEGVEDHQELPYPSHRLVAEHELVLAHAHGWALIAVATQLPSENQDDINDLLGLHRNDKEKASDSKHQGDKKKRGRKRPA